MCLSSNKKPTRNHYLFVCCNSIGLSWWHDSVLKQTDNRNVPWKWFSADGLNLSYWLHSKSNCCSLITGEFCPHCQRPDSTHPETAVTSQERMQLLAKELQASLNTSQPAFHRKSVKYRTNRASPKVVVQALTTRNDGRTWSWRGWKTRGVWSFLIFSPTPLSIDTILVAMLSLEPFPTVSKNVSIRVAKRCKIYGLVSGPFLKNSPKIQKNLKILKILEIFHPCATLVFTEENVDLVCKNLLVPDQVVVKTWHDALTKYSKVKFGCLAFGCIAKLSLTYTLLFKHTLGYASSALQIVVSQSKKKQMRQNNKLLEIATTTMLVWEG